MNDTVRELLRTLSSRLKSTWVFPSETGDTPLDGQNFVNRVFVKRSARHASTTSRGTVSGTRNA